LTSQIILNHTLAIVTGFGHTEKREIHDRQRTEPSEYLKQTQVSIQEQQL